MLSVTRHGPLLLLLVGILLILDCNQPPRVIGFPQYEGPVKSGGFTRLGKLIVAGGCLRLSYPDSNNPNSSALVIWPSNFAMSVKGNSIRIIDGAGLIAARVGDDVSYSGYGTKDVSTLALRQPPRAGCPGPYRILGDRFRALGPDEPTVVSIPGSTLFFPRQKSITTSEVEMLTMLNAGELVLDGDCLRVGTAPYRKGENNPNATIVWPAGSTPHIEDGVAHIRDDTGRIIARVGDRIYMDGSWTLFEPEGSESERCPGKYWETYNVWHPRTYEIIVENQSKDTVVVDIDKNRLGSKVGSEGEDEIIEGCSTKRFGGESAVRPRGDELVEVYEMIYRGRSGGLVRGDLVLKTKVSPRFPEDSSDDLDWYLEVVVPGATDDECQ